jgi:hypothetical protein
MRQYVFMCTKVRYLSIKKIKSYRSKVDMTCFAPNLDVFEELDPPRGAKLRDIRILSISTQTSVVESTMQ